MALKRSLLMMILVLALCSFGTTRQVFAKGGSNMTIEDASPQEVVDGMANKFARGVTNIATGWLELPKQIYLTCKEEGYAKGLTVGPMKGLGMTLVRTGAGIGETVSFPLAYPGFYDPLFDPSYVWQKE
jgi:putative exosortase-associated protein (TIGR04073 family)